MKRIRSSSFLRLGLGTVAASTLGALALAGCQSILGINPDRPLVDGGSDAQADANPTPPNDSGPPPVPDAGGGADASDDTGITGMVDASEASPPPVDAGPDGPTFESPLQVDVSSVLMDNTVVTTAAGGLPLNYMDGDNTSDGNDFPTMSEALLLQPMGGAGLPDNAFFAASNQDTPNIQLAWNNSNNLNYNSLIISSVTSNPPVAIPVPPGIYRQVQVYATGTQGPLTLTYSFTYVESPPVSGSLVLPDWCASGAPSAGQFFVAFVGRVEYGTTYNGGLTCHIFAINLNPDTGKHLTSFAISAQVLGSASTANLVFYGATAW